VDPERDDLLDRWTAVRPDLDPSPLATVGRVIVLAQFLERSVDAALARHGLNLGQFDILATIRRSGSPTGLTPKQLLKSVVLSSGGMTSRLDKLEYAGLVKRHDDPDDRRGVLVALTAKGLKKIDAATATRFEEAERSCPELPAEEREQLADLLRAWLRQIDTASLSKCAS